MNSYVQQSITLGLVIFFTSVSLLHFYWAVGGRWGFKAVLPQRKSGEFVIVPHKRDCISVGLLLLVCSLLYMIKLGLSLPVSSKLLTFGYYAVPTGLALRTVGDFRYVGLFKRIKHTPFAIKDKLYFTPLCLLIGILGFVVV